MSQNNIADLLLPGVSFNIEATKLKFPNRVLNIGACVTRFAPSPTGFLHIGGVYTALISSKIAHQSNGVFILRIEDTDKKREKTGSIKSLIEALHLFSLNYDEGILNDLKELGDYGPYIQSKRKDIYQVFVKYLLMKGLAYPCFCSEDDLDFLRKRQESLKLRTGYYDHFALHRNINIEEVKFRLNDNEPYVIRFKNINKNSTATFHDLIKGQITLTDNPDDIVLLKTDGMPTYHLAHVVDDYLMQTTHVLRADEWMPSLPLHLELFKAFELKPPLYGHISPILKLDGSSKRKLSKRKDPEASVDFYFSEGYPIQVIIEYLLNIANSDFESWRKLYPKASHNDFILKLEKMKGSGALFDIKKLDKLGKDYISSLKTECVFDSLYAWSKNYDLEFNELIKKYNERLIRILSIGRSYSEKKRKDYSKWSEVKNLIFYFFDEYYYSDEYIFEFPPNLDHKLLINILNEYQKVLDIELTQEAWFEQMKIIALKFKYATCFNDYKKNTEKYVGTIADFSNLIRISITKRSNTFELYNVIKILGITIVKERLLFTINNLSKNGLLHFI
jgi:glutamyl-tRNA synthetase